MLINTVSPISYTYQIGNSLPVNHPTYVEREADLDLYQTIKTGNFSYIFAPKQTGKSSLITHTIHKLKQENIACVLIDLNQIGNQQFTSVQWYADLAKTIVNQLQLKLSIANWWRTSTLELLLDGGKLSPTAKFYELLENVLISIPTQVVIFIDHIEQTLNLNFSLEKFWELVNDCYQKNRQSNPQFKRLNWVIVGEVNSTDLIKEDKHKLFTPGQNIHLSGLQLDQSWGLMQGIIKQLENPLIAFKEILKWTGGQPLLTQKICQLIQRYKIFIPNGKESEILTEFLHQQIIDFWQKSDQPAHLRSLQTKIVPSYELLKVYAQIWQLGEIPYHVDNHYHNQLILSGLITNNRGKLVISNLIYAEIFNKTWLKNALFNILPFEEESSQNVKVNHQNYQSDNKPLSEVNSIEELTLKVRDLSVAEFIQSLDDITGQFQLFLRAIDLINDESQESTLAKLIEALTLKIGQILQADRSTLYLLDQEKNELWSLVAKGDGGGSLEIRINANRGYAGKAATTKKIVNIPFDLYDDPDSIGTKEFDKKSGYRTYSMLTLPLLNYEDKLVAVVQLINKLKTTKDEKINTILPLDQRIDKKGFTSDDEKRFYEFAGSIALILESSHSFDKAAQRQRAADALMKATSSLSKGSLDLQETLKNVMNEAKKLMNADRGTLWLIDEEKNQLWTKIELADGTIRELRIPRSAGFAGQVATTKQPLIIPFDLYNHPNSETSKKTDQDTGYRTCSMLCMPVFNSGGELIAVTQLVNKKKSGEFPPYNPQDWPQPPEVWKASFNRTDQDFMETFNIQAGVALQNAKLFETIKQQERTQRDILRSLSNGVIYTNKDGKVIAANESAKSILGYENDTEIEQKSLLEVVKIINKLEHESEDNKLQDWFNIAIKAEESKDRKQYYPDQLLDTTHDEKHTVNISINTIADVGDENKVVGVLVVIEDISDEKRIKDMMYRYMSEEVAEQLLKQGGSKIGGDKKEVSILFSDIRSYTTLTENMSSEEVVNMLNEYFESMVEAVFKNKGTLDKYIGDAIMSVFGSPLPLEDHAWKAVQTAIEMRHRLTAFNQPRIAANLPIIKIGIGINSGEVISGNIGSSRRMEHTAIGDAVNLGSRLESASKQYGVDIIISESTYQECQDKIITRDLDWVKVKGKNEAVHIYELVDLVGEEIPEAKKQSIDHYHQGRKYYLNKEFEKAIAEFTQAEMLRGEDKASRKHIERCQQFIENPPSDAEWEQGIWTLTDK
jgi:adenylate cyclase